MQQLHAAKDKVLGDIRQLTAAATTPAKSLDVAMEYLHTHRPNYHWVGIYRLEEDTLILGPYRGPTTDHARIPVGRGVCGTAVAENRNQIVADVRAVSNYLACNLATRSEMVVLIRHPQDGKILGQIDIDGTKLNQFDAAEEELINAVAQILAPYLMKYIETLDQ